MLRTSLRGAALAASLLFISAPVSAHENRGVGQLTTVVGWLNEPSFAGSVNGVSFRATHDDKGVAGAKLKVDVSFPGAAAPLTLTMDPAFNDVGHYKAHLVPSRPGAYTFRIYGTVDGKPFNQTYKAGQSTFAVVESAKEVEYPEKDPGNDELAALAKQQETRIAALKTEAGKARDAADQARLIAIVALLVGVVGAVLGVRKGRAKISS